jgi:hypothetical protein
MTMMTPGKIENWTSIVDMGNSTLHKLPKKVKLFLKIKVLITFAKILQKLFKGRLSKTHMINVSAIIRIVWMIISPFLNEVVKSKTCFFKGSTPPELLNIIHPS